MQERRELLQRKVTALSSACDVKELGPERGRAWGPEMVVSASEKENTGIGQTCDLVF